MGVCRCICTSVHICVLRPKVDLSIFLSPPHLLFETDHPSAGITGTHSYTQLLHLPLQRVPRTQTQVLLLYSKHIPKRAISQPFGGGSTFYISSDGSASYPPSWILCWFGYVCGGGGDESVCEMCKCVLHMHAFLYGDTGVCRCM